MFSIRKILSAGLLLAVVAGTVSATSRDASAHERWHEGRWFHDRHEGRLGWWWVVGPRWSYYPDPYARTVIIQQQQQQPQVTVVQAAPVPVAQPAPMVVQVPTLYYCKATGTYYPETMSCPGGWTSQAAGTPPAP